EDPDDGGGVVVATGRLAGRGTCACEQKDCLVDLGNDVRPTGAGGSLPELLGDRQQGKSVLIGIAPLVLLCHGTMVGSRHHTAEEHDLRCRCRQSHTARWAPRNFWAPTSGGATSGPRSASAYRP